LLGSQPRLLRWRCIPVADVLAGGCAVLLSRTPDFQQTICGLCRRRQAHKLAGRARVLFFGIGHLPPLGGYFQHLLFAKGIPRLCGALFALSRLGAVLFCLRHPITPRWSEDRTWRCSIRSATVDHQRKSPAVRRG
jgi:hypothetical protein